MCGKYIHRYYCRICFVILVCLDQLLHIFTALLTIFSEEGETKQRWVLQTIFHSVVFEGVFACATMFALFYSQLTLPPLFTALLLPFYVNCQIRMEKRQKKGNQQKFLLRAVP